MTENDEFYHIFIRYSAVMIYEHKKYNDKSEDTR